MWWSVCSVELSLMTPSSLPVVSLSVSFRVWHNSDYTGKETWSCCLRTPVFHRAGFIFRVAVKCTMHTPIMQVVLEVEAENSAVVWAVICTGGRYRRTHREVRVDQKEHGEMEKTGMLVLGMCLTLASLGCTQVSRPLGRDTFPIRPRLLSFCVQFVYSQIRQRKMKHLNAFQRRQMDINMRILGSLFIIYTEKKRQTLKQWVK